MSRFTDNELDIMRILWEHGELKPAEIIERFPRPIKNPAMRSFLSVLLRKGHIARHKVGKAYFYYARTRPDRAFSAMLRKMVDVFCNGSAEALVCHLIREEKLTDAQLLELKKIAQQSNSSRSRKGSSQ